MKKLLFLSFICFAGCNGDKSDTGKKASSTDTIRQDNTPVIVTKDIHGYKPLGNKKGIDRNMGK
jgi:hypothetical protein